MTIGNLAGRGDNGWRWWRPALVALAAAIAGAWVWSGEIWRGGRDPGALWRIVSTCVDRREADYCGCPAFDLSCCGDATRPDRDVVWARTDDFVAIRNKRMCGCPEGFVAGLAMPRTRVTGIEDPRRPDALWPFAWGVAKDRIPDEREIALVINPEVARSQNQMHVHVLRLKPEARAMIDAAAASSGGDAAAAGTNAVHPAPGGTNGAAAIVDLADLDGVFAAASARVGAAGMGRSGILVARHGAGFRMLLTRGSSPQVHTVNRCDRPAWPGLP